MTLNTLRKLSGENQIMAEIAEQVELDTLYEGYVLQQDRIVERARKQENAPIPLGFDFGTAQGLRTEAREKLELMRPSTLGQAGRINGVTPADISVLMVYLRRIAQTETG